ncbi:MAG: HAD family hydrolase, partial [Planctomycetota bacterium]
MAKPLPVSRLAALIGILCICSGGCEREPEQRSPSVTVKLRPGNWVPSVRAELEALIARNAGKGRKVVFDFDNTLICRDIGEATFAAMVEGGTLVPTPAARAVSPSFVHEGRRVSVEGAADLIPYYEAFVSATDHQPGNTDPGFSSFAWLVQVMAGLTPADIVRSSEKAYARGIGKRDSSDPGLGETRVNGYRRPFFQPEMVDLVGALLRSGYDVYVVSASNVWTVRWMVTKQLNGLMRADDAETPLIPPDHVIGVSVLLRDTRTGRLYKDQLLVKENKAYANLEGGELANYKLTSRIAPPLSGYFGKVANIMKHV